MSEHQTLGFTVSYTVGYVIVAQKYYSTSADTSETLLKDARQRRDRLRLKDYTDGKFTGPWEVLGKVNSLDGKTTEWVRLSEILDFVTEFERNVPDKFRVTAEELTDCL